ncbi:MAG: SMP-30/gluconolactonase/LRE family protein [Limisphaerales bacterium]
MRKLFLGLLAGVSGSLVAQDMRSDMALHKLLIDGANWELVAKGMGFADGPCTDRAGNFYYSDLRPGAIGPGIFRISKSGERKKLFAEGASGLKFGPDGRLYACQGKTKQLVAFDLKTGKKSVLAEDVRPNDLVVTRRGHVYFTETGKKQVVLVQGGKKRAVDEGITAPNGIALSADDAWLAVSDFKGRHVWLFRVEADGSLTYKEPFMTTRTKVAPGQKKLTGPLPQFQTSCRGDGMSSDKQGRWYVATSLGVQFFDPLGRISGVLPNPGEKGMTSVMLGGPKQEWLYATCGDAIFRRRVQATGTAAFGPDR